MTTDLLMDDLPSWCHELRPHQVTAIEEIMEAYREGARVVVLDAPTGSGKTLIAEVVRRQLETRALYTCTTKSLQDQVLHDYPYARVLKGRSNYIPLRAHADLALTCADCDKTEHAGDKQWCSFCDPVSECPYERAKYQALSADLAVLNTSYLLTEANYIGRFSKQEFAILDECDLLESELMRHVEVGISARRAQQLKIGAPAKVTVADSWREWADHAVDVLKYHRTAGEGVRAARERRRVLRLRSQLETLQRGLKDDSWVFTGRDGRVAFKPVQVRELAREMLWPHAQKWLLMSATVLSPRVLLEDELGLEDRWHCVQVPMTFPVESRRVHVIPVADMSKKGIEADGGSVGAMGRALQEVRRRHSGESMLVHCVSYSLGESLCEVLRETGPVFTYRSAAERGEALRRFRDTRGAVLVAPSFDRGVDLPDSACRIVVVAKLPYPYLGDRQVAARLYAHGGQTWYRTQCARSLVQMTGRHVRHEDDWGVSYILDSNFAQFWPGARRDGLLPRWWQDALTWESAL